MSYQPIIGITLDHEEQGDYSPFPYYILRQNYFDAVSHAGGIPLALPLVPEAAEQYISLIDGLIIPGGFFDIPPKMYGDGDVHESVILKEARTQFEFTMTERALASKLPTLGICGGQQLMNVALGGSLIQDIASEIEVSLEHEVKDRLTAAHEVVVVENTLLHTITGATHFGVNSSHHQAIKQPGQGAVVNAHAPDGVIEGIEYPDHPFFLGVQWHPEYHVQAHDRAIFQAFISACKT